MHWNRVVCQLLVRSLIHKFAPPPLSGLCRFSFKREDPLSAAFLLFLLFLPGTSFSMAVGRGCLTLSVSEFGCFPLFIPRGIAQAFLILVLVLVCLNCATPFCVGWLGRFFFSLLPVPDCFFPIASIKIE